MWFKLKCYYNAKTELFDRTLTDLRSPYDQTEAYIIGENRSLSHSNAIWLHRYICGIADYYKIPYYSDLIKSYEYRLCAQGWIDLYDNLFENGEMNFITGHLGGG